MTQPIEVAYVEIVARTANFEKNLKKDTERAFKDVENRASRASKKIADEFRNASSGIGNSFNSIRKNISGSKDEFSAVGKAGQAALTGVSTASNAANTVLKSFNSSLVAATNGFGRLATTGPVGLTALAVGFVVVAEAAAVAARVVQDLIAIISFGVALLPGLITGVLSSFLVLKAATSGISDAFTELTKKQNKAGSSGVSNARAVADAQRGVLQAQKDLIKAKDDEIKRVRTLAIEIQRARATEARAADDVLKAEYALQRARDVGTPRSQIEAQLALDEAKASLVEAKADTKNLAAEKAKADKVGINGSEQVLRAQEAIRDAQDRLAQSQIKASAGIASQTTAFDGLTKSAQAFVLALVSAKKQLGPLQDALQEAFFAGTAPLIQPIVDSLIDLQPELVAVATGFGDIFKEILTFLATPEAKEALRAVLVGISDFLTAIKPSIGPLLKAFAGLVGDSGQFGKVLGEKVAIALNKIADFVSKVDIKKLFSDAKDAVKELAPIIGNLVVILVNLFRIFAFAGQFILPEIAFNLQIVADMFDNMKSAVKAVAPAVIEFFNGVMKKVGLAKDAIVSGISSIPGKITSLGGKFLTAGKSVVAKLFEGISTAGGFATDFAKNLANTFVRFFNNTVIKSINTGIKAIQDGLNRIPGLSLALPKLSNIPALEKGGLLTEDGIFRGGEKGRKEAVLPLEDSRVMAMIGNAIATAGGLGNGGGITFAPGSIVIQFSGGTPPTDARARQIGTAIASSAASSLERRNIRSRIRTM